MPDTSGLPRDAAIMPHISVRWSLGNTQKHGR